MWYNDPMNEDPCNTAKIVANMLHDHSMLIDAHQFDATTLLKTFSCVEAARGFDEEFMSELYDCLRVLAQEDILFEDALVQTDIMCYQDIWGVCNDDELAVGRIIESLSRGEVWDEE